MDEGVSVINKRLRNIRVPPGCQSGRSIGWWVGWWVGGSVGGSVGVPFVRRNNCMPSPLFT